MAYSSTCPRGSILLTSLPGECWQRWLNPLPRLLPFLLCKAVLPFGGCQLAEGGTCTSSDYVWGCSCQSNNWMVAAETRWESWLLEIPLVGYPSGGGFPTGDRRSAHAGVRWTLEGTLKMKVTENSPLGDFSKGTCLCWDPAVVNLKRFYPFCLSSSALSLPQRESEIAGCSVREIGPIPTVLPCVALGRLRRTRQRGEGRGADLPQ